MKVYEFQACELLRQAGVSSPAGVVCRSGDEAAAAFARLGGDAAMVKAQVFAGGRGKGGGVKKVRSADEARRETERMLKSPLVTHQTGPAGVAVRAVLLSGCVDIAHEYYLGVAVDRAAGAAVMMASGRGGVDIEQVAAESPEAIAREPLHPLLGLQPFQVRKLAAAIGLKGKQAAVFCDVALRLAQFFIAKDCSLAEINPLIATPAGQLLALDAKLNFDDNALFCHPEIAALADPADENPAESRARAAGLSYIALSGNIGCVVNGAGLAMATMDIIKLHGGEPANFLDVGGGVSRAGAIEAFRILLADPKVRAVLVNIFGGIAHCDLVADALIQAGREVGFGAVPVVVRLEGTNVEPARELLRAAATELPTLITATDLTDAAKKVVAATDRMKGV